MELVCRALWRRGASHWRGVLTMAAPVICHRAPPCPRLCPPAPAMPAWPSRRGLNTRQSRCWSCQAMLSPSELFCPSCLRLQPPDSTADYFQLLHCERSFDINIQELQRKYRNLQRSLHPDYFSQKPQHERDLSDQQSSLVNKAYNTLLSPLKRGIYLLSLHGITFKEGTEGGMDAPFLMEVLEINERLNEADTSAEIEDIGSFVQAKCHSLTENVREAFQKGKLCATKELIEGLLPENCAHVNKPDDLEGAKMFLSRLKYYRNILDQVKKKMIP